MRISVNKILVTVGFDSQYYSAHAAEHLSSLVKQIVTETFKDDEVKSSVQPRSSHLQKLPYGIQVEVQVQSQEGLPVLERLPEEADCSLKELLLIGAEHLLEQILAAIELDAKYDFAALLLAQRTPESTSKSKRPTHQRISVVLKLVTSQELVH